MFHLKQNGGSISIHQTFNNWRVELEGNNNQQSLQKYNPPHVPTSPIFFFFFLGSFLSISLQHAQTRSPKSCDIPNILPISKTYTILISQTSNFAKFLIFFLFALQKLVSNVYWWFSDILLILNSPNFAVAEDSDITIRDTLI